MQIKAINQFNGASSKGYQCFQLRKAPERCNYLLMGNKLESILKTNAVCFLRLLALTFDEGCSLQFSVINDIHW